METKLKLEKTSAKAKDSFLQWYTWQLAHINTDLFLYQAHVTSGTNSLGLLEH